MVPFLKKTAALSVGLSVLLMTLPAVARGDESRLDRIKLRIQQQNTKKPTQAPKAQPKPIVTHPSPNTLRAQLPTPKAVELPKPVDQSQYKSLRAEYEFMANLLTKMNKVDTNVLGQVISRSDADRAEELANGYAGYVRQMGGLMEKAQTSPLADYDLATLSQIRTNSTAISDEFQSIITVAKKRLENLGY